MAENICLIIDNNEGHRQELMTILDFIDIEEVQAMDSHAWREVIAQHKPEAILLGDCGSAQEQLKIFHELHEINEVTPVIVIKDKEDAEIDPEVVKGALAIIERPIKYRELNTALQQAQIYRESKKQLESQRSPELFRSLVGNSRGIRHVRTLIEQVADSDATVLILGESGTGKEVVARNLHYRSKRRNRSFVPINCGAIPPDLLESELFGHEKGAFTGAITSRQGRFEMAEGGTLFLDEIGDMSLPMQVKLLRVLQERTFERVGSNKSITADVRIVAATHRNLEEAIKQGKFREDLYYRLNVFPIEMPPLRDRKEDIPLLINELITRLEHEKRGSVRLTPSAIMVLCQYHWPGNVRELANLIERLVIMYPFGVVDMMDLPEKFRTGLEAVAMEPVLPMPQVPLDNELLLMTPRLPREGIDLKEHLNFLEYHLIKQALDDADGVVAHAANRLKLRRTTLVEKMRKFGLQRADEVS